MAIIDTIEYSVCADCLQEIAYGDHESHDITDHVRAELNGRKGHFSVGIEQTEHYPDGDGYVEFSYAACELCRSTLGGSRHGVTLFITGH